MVQKIEEIIFSDNYDIKQTQLSIDKGDTIILKIDQEKIDEMEKDFENMMEFWKSIYLREAQPISLPEVRTFCQQSLYWQL